MSEEKLARMANQIAAFFDSQPGDRAAEEIAAHLRRFWAPPMRDRLIAHAAAGTQDLSPSVRAATALLARKD